MKTQCGLQPGCASWRRKDEPGNPGNLRHQCNGISPAPLLPLESVQLSAQPRSRPRSNRRHLSASGPRLRHGTPYRWRSGQRRWRRVCLHRQPPFAVSTDDRVMIQCCRCVVRKMASCITPRSPSELVFRSDSVHAVCTTASPAACQQNKNNPRCPAGIGRLDKSTARWQPTRHVTSRPLGFLPMSGGQSLPEGGCFWSTQ